MKHLILYGFPLAADVIVSLVLFVGRHALASRGFNERTVGSIVLFYGIGYVISSLLMTRIVKAAYAKVEMLGALAGIVLICVLLAQARALLLIQALYGLFPFAISLFFNAFQIYMLGISNQDARPLVVTAGHFTFSWSIGFALGPFVSSLLRTVAYWSQIYYLAAVLAGIGILLLYRFEADAAPAPAAARAARRVEPVKRQSLVGPAWMGLLVGWTIWNAVLIYWPVQTVRLNVSMTLRGLMEFVFALTQGLSALVLTYVRGWHRKPVALLMLGAFGVAALVLFSGVAQGGLFLIGALLYGVYTGSMFSLMSYHAMVDEEKAVERVALNETFVGICFLASSPVAAMVHQEGTPLGPSYRLLALVLAVGLGLQALYAASQVKGETAVSSGALKV